MIRFDDVTVHYAGATEPVLHRVTLHVPEGELALVVGRTGSGKSTLLRAVNGLVPHFTGGTLTGRVTVDGRDTRTHPPRELADVVGYVGQDPLAGFVMDIVEDELAYGMESLALPPAVMRRRVEETLDLLGLADLRARPLRTLSGGQRQRVAIGSVLATHPKVLVLDEPTSALDPAAAEDVLAAVQRLVHDLGLTVLLAEHRLERVVQYADRVIRFGEDGRTVESGTPAEIMVRGAAGPPVVALGRLAGWDPLPLTVRDARRLAGPLRERLAHLVTPTKPDGERPTGDAAAPVATARRVSVSYGRMRALHSVSLAVAPGEIVAVMGRNGAGKSTLLNTLVGLRRPDSGEVRVGGRAPADLPGRSLLSHVGLVPQEPGDLLYADTVLAECATSDRDAGLVAGTTARLLGRLAPDVDGLLHPADLSEGQRLALVLAIVLAAEPPLLLLDEPTRGLDYGAKERLVAILRDLAGRGHAIVLATHDVELVADAATRTVVLADGEIVADGSTSEVVVGSPTFAPQVAKILGAGPWLTVSQVAAALAAVS